MTSIGTILGNLWDMLCQIWEFAIGLVSGLYVAITSLLNTVPLVTRIAGSTGTFLNASILLFLSVYLVKFLIGR